jgi:hypothetical protein
MKQVFMQFRKSARRILIAAPLATVLLVGCDKDDDYDYPDPKDPEIESTVISGSGDVSTQIAAFRSLIGDSLNVAPGAPATGRREVNWDGVPPDFTDANAFPPDFFGSTDPAAANGRKRGLVYENAGTTFRVSTSDFSDIDPSYADQFDPFSGNKTFGHNGDNVSIASFRVPGTNTNASVKGFGLIFTDVDESNSTTVEYFNGSKSLGVFKAPKRSAGSSFSFLGVFFPEEKVTKVKITAGNGVLGAGVLDVSNGGAKDLVVMDDFFYSEPVAN